MRGTCLLRSPGFRPTAMSFSSPVISITMLRLLHLPSSPSTDYATYSPAASPHSTPALDCGLFNSKPPAIPAVRISIPKSAPPRTPIVLRTQSWPFVSPYSLQAEGLRVVGLFLYTACVFSIKLVRTEAGIGAGPGGSCTAAVLTYCFDAHDLRRLRQYVRWKHQ